MSEQPRISEDGKFYWDGSKWVPLPTAPASPVPAKVVVTKQPRGAWNSLVGYGCMGIAAIFVFAALATLCGPGHTP
jgi:hypothetical protein